MQMCYYDNITMIYFLYLIYFRKNNYLMLNVILNKNYIEKYNI